MSATRTAKSKTQQRQVGRTPQSCLKVRDNDEKEAQTLPGTDHRTEDPAQVAINLGPE